MASSKIELTKPVVSKASCRSIGARRGMEEAGDQMRALLQTTQDAVRPGLHLRRCPGRPAAQFGLHMRQANSSGLMSGEYGGKTHSSSQSAFVATNCCGNKGSVTEGSGVFCS